MNYKETIDYLFNATPVFEHVGASAYKEGLSNTHALDEHFHHPHQKFRTIHVAGTNGKGSCSHSLAAILQSEGYKVGLYTSPHLVDFRERIRVNGQCISEQYVVDFVQKERSFFEPLHPSFFELTTALAFKYFAEQEVDFAVVEVGLGGRLDCTNIITPLLSVITNISFDHTQFLGNTLEKITAEKAGIIKRGVPVVVGEYTKETRGVFERIAAEQKAPLTFAEDSEEILNTELADRGVVYLTKHFGQIESELAGAYQAKNMNTILHAVAELQRQGVLKAPKSISDGLSHVCRYTGLQGRWQQLAQEPRVVCDTGHNVAAWEYLGKQLEKQPCSRLRIVFGMVDDKDIDHVLRLMPTRATFYFTRAQSKRAIPETVVKDKAATYGLEGSSFATVAEAYAQALADSSKDDLIFVGGSSYVVADLLTALNYSAI